MFEFKTFSGSNPKKFLAYQFKKRGIQQLCFSLITDIYKKKNLNEKGLSLVRINILQHVIKWNLSSINFADFGEAS